MELGNITRDNLFYSFQYHTLIFILSIILVHLFLVSLLHFLPYSYNHTTIINSHKFFHIHSSDKLEYKRGKILSYKTTSKTFIKFRFVCLILKVLEKLSNKTIGNNNNLCLVVPLKFFIFLTLTF